MPEQNPSISTPVTLVVEAYSCEEHETGPGYAVITVSQSFIDRMSKWARLFKENSFLESLTVTDAPDRWGSAEALGITGDSLRLWRDNDFWYEARSGIADYRVETRAIDIHDLHKAVSLGPDTPTAIDGYRWENGTLYVAGDPGILDDLIEDYLDSIELANQTAA